MFNRYSNECVHNVTQIYSDINDAIKNNDLSKLKKKIDLLNDDSMNVNIISTFTKLCIYQRRVDILKYLLKKHKKMGYNVRMYDNFYLKLAIYKGYLEIVKILVESGSDINCNDGSPMRIAFQNNHLEIIKFILKRVL